MISVGHALALESPTYDAFVLESIEKLFRRNPGLDNPMMGIRPSNAVSVVLETAVYGAVGLLFTAGVVLLAAVHNRLRYLSLLASLLFSGGCLFFASGQLDYAADCFRWRFILEGLGMSAVLLGLCIGGISAVVLCLPFGNEPQREQKEARIGR